VGECFGNCLFYIIYLFLILFQALGTHGVTLKMPPKSVLFSAFQKLPVDNLNNPASPSGSATQALAYPMSSLPPASLFNPYQAQPMAFPWILPQQMPPQVPTNLSHAYSQPPRTASNCTDSSSDFKFPSISDFLTLLVEKNTRRKALADAVIRFETLDFYNIDEIADFSEGRLTGKEFELSPGNAQFLLREVKAEMKRIHRRKRARLD
jgi:hypothetical protein